MKPLIKNLDWAFLILAAAYLFGRFAVGLAKI